MIVMFLEVLYMQLLRPVLSSQFAVQIIVFSVHIREGPAFKTRNFHLVAGECANPHALDWSSGESMDHQFVRIKIIKNKWHCCKNIGVDANGKHMI